MRRLTAEERAGLVEWLEFAMSEYHRQGRSKHPLDQQLPRRLAGDLRDGAGLIVERPGGPVEVEPMADVGQSAPIAWPAEDEWLTIEQGAVRYGVPARTLRNWASGGPDRGGVRSRRVGSGSRALHLIHREDLESKTTRRSR